MDTKKGISRVTLASNRFCDKDCELRFYLISYLFVKSILLPLPLSFYLEYEMYLIRRDFIAI